MVVRTVQMLTPDSSVGREPDMRFRVHIPSDSTTHVLPVLLFFQSVCCLRGYKMWFVCAVRVSSVNTASNGYFMRWLVPVSPSITSPSLTDSHPLLVSWWRYWRNSRLYSTTRKSPLYSMYMVSWIACCWILHLPIIKEQFGKEYSVSLLQITKLKALGLSPSWDLTFHHLSHVFIVINPPISLHSTTPSPLLPPLWCLVHNFMGGHIPCTKVASDLVVYRNLDLKSFLFVCMCCAIFCILFSGYFFPFSCYGGLGRSCVGKNFFLYLKAYQFNS